MGGQNFELGRVSFPNGRELIQGLIPWERFNSGVNSLKKALGYGKVL